MDSNSGPKSFCAGAALVASSLLVLCALGVGLQWLEVETSFESYLPQHNPAQQLYQRFRLEFGSGERVVLLLRPIDIYDRGGFRGSAVELDEVRGVGRVIRTILVVSTEAVEYDTRYGWKRTCSKDPPWTQHHQSPQTIRTLYAHLTTMTDN